MDMKFKVILFGVVALLGLIGFLVGSQYSKQQVNSIENKNVTLKKKIDTLEAKNESLNKTVERQSKNVIEKEEDQIRETSKTFVEKMFNMKSDSSFKDKSEDIKSLVTNDYYDKLFNKSSNNYNIYDDISIDNVHVYFERYNPRKDSYKVFVQFDERVSDTTSDKVDKKQSSVQLNMKRENDKWLVEDLKRFNLKPLGR
ncbi:hypothetical protein [Staphylococcus caeli]|uniref:Transposon-related protein n=1 Tax=Staphylococcus caeli TaxID=2201815 RepID=A0A1D4PZG7_9STAP|nr:hypothetical protein [Staphylococcus caeli]SCT28337.1 transposon-related protein [Staphylococcus caeli]SCT33783.1 transposon-related protein [Staphylococcus caeli]